MKYIRALKKIDKAIDAMIDLQQDYSDEIAAGGVVYETSRVLDTLNSIRTSLEGVV